MKSLLDKSKLKKFVDAGYKKKGEARNVNGMVLDNELSTRRNKVYVDPETGKATHVIAGTDNLKDWANNLLIPLGLHHHTNRYKNSEKTQKRANEKYGKENVDLVTHSQSGNIAENLQKRNLVGGENTTLNPAILGSHNKNLKVVKSRFDPVSLLTRTNKNDEVLKETSYNPLTEHSTAILGSGMNTEIQSILFSRPEWTLIKAKSWLKKHGYKTSVDTKTEHYRFRQTEPDIYSSFRTKHIGDNISMIIGLKKKGGSIINNMNEQDLIKRMAKLSHDLHLHHIDNGHGEDILKAYKLIGHGIKESVCGGQISGCGKKSGNKDIDNFNGWFKAVGQKFKPLMKYVNPVLQAGSDRAVDMVGDLGKSPQEIAAEKAGELFTGKKEKPAPVQVSPTLTTNEKRRLKAKQAKMDELEEEEYQSTKPRRKPTYYEDEEDYEPPPRPRRQTSRYVEDDYEPPSRQQTYIPQPLSGPSSYERSFQAQPTQGRGMVGKKMKEMYGKGTGKDLGANLAGNIGRLADAGTNKIINKYLGGPEGTGLKKGRMVKGSPEAKAWAEKMRLARSKGKGF
jgi:hypothetical protein